MSYWAAAQLQPQRDGLALQCLRQAGFETYAPVFASHRTVHGRKVVRTPLLFPRLSVRPDRAAVAHGAVGARRGACRPERRDAAAVPEGVIMALKARETGGLIDLPRPRNSAPAIACELRAARSPGTSVCTPA